MDKKALGGYFELEINSGTEYHENAIALNTGRNALEYILRARNYCKLYLPFYTCDVLLEPLKRLSVLYEFYNVDGNLEPLFDFKKIKVNEGFLYTNYFGIKDRFIHELSNRTTNLIVDNAQSFFSRPLKGVDTFYSPRKFFGVSDGAYLFIDKKLQDDFVCDTSYNRMSHLLIRADRNAEEGYTDFSTNDHSLNNEPIKRMSNLTHKLLSSIDYDDVRRIRRENFSFLHEQLNSKNKLNIDTDEESVPMVYPYWTGKQNLKNHLVSKKIYCPTYWPNVFDWCKEDDLELQLMREIVHLPIDQRYSLTDMKYLMRYV